MQVRSAAIRRSPCHGIFCPLSRCSATPALSLNDLLSTVFSDSQGKCPPCFNCLLPAFTWCGQFGRCNEYNGQCKCLPGWGGINCLIPYISDSLVEEIRCPRLFASRACPCRASFLLNLLHHTQWSSHPKGCVGVSILRSMLYSL
ncbi:hypothetical protein BKA83DRAFT_4185025 [Pisolithus microcarpus]|nr:hypothetical protein BKA83DRAFT_4185025 [Pisolithus microcarpus]